jgi:hypothetical protein
VIPIMLSRLGWATFLVFACLNIVSLPIAYFFFPETAGRSLEEMNMMFASDSWLVSKNVAEYDRMVGAAGGNVALAARRFLDEVDAEQHETDARAHTYMEEGKMTIHVEQQDKDASDSEKMSN